MASNEVKLLAEKLLVVVESIEKISSLSEQADSISQAIQSNSRISEAQLKEFQKSTEVAQTAVAQLVNMGSSFGSVIENGEKSVEEVRSAGSQLLNLTNQVGGLVDGYRDRIREFEVAASTSLGEAISSVVSDFSTATKEIQESLTVTKTLLLEALTGLPSKMNAMVEPTLLGLNQASREFIQTAELLRTGLEGVPEVIAGQVTDLARPSIEDLRSSVDAAIARLTNVFEPGLNQFLATMHQAETDITSAGEVVRSEIKRVTEVSVSEFSTLSANYREAIEKADSASSRMEGFLNNSSAFTNVVSAVERNLALSIEIDKLLVSKKQPFFARLDFAVVGAAVGFFVGREILNTSDAKIAIVLAPSVIMALTAEPLLTGLFKNLRYRNNKVIIPPPPHQP